MWWVDHFHWTKRSVFGFFFKFFTEFKNRTILKTVNSSFFIRINILRCRASTHLRDWKLDSHKILSNIGIDLRTSCSGCERDQPKTWPKQLLKYRIIFFKTLCACTSARAYWFVSCALVMQLIPTIVSRYFIYAYSNNIIFCGSLLPLQLPYCSSCITALLHLIYLFV